MKQPIQLPSTMPTCLAAVCLSTISLLQAQNSAAPNIAFLDVREAMNGHLNVPAENARLSQWNDQLNESISSRKIKAERARELYEDEKFKMQARLFTDVSQATARVTNGVDIDLLINTSFSYKSKNCVLVWRTNPHDITSNVTGELTNLTKRLVQRPDMRLKKVGIIDVEKVLNSDGRRRIESTKINQEAETKRKLLGEKKARLTTIRKTTAVYRELVNNLKKEEREIEEDLDKASEAMDATLMVKIKSIMNKVVSAERFDLILNPSFSIKGEKAIIYTSPAINDLTFTITELLNDREAPTNFHLTPTVTAVIDFEKISTAAANREAQIQKVIQQYANSKGIDLIFNKSIHGADNKYIDKDNQFIISHSSGVADITSDVLERLNQ